MCFWIKIFPLILLLNNVSTETSADYTFNTTSLGYSGILITWKFQGTGRKVANFNFNVFIAEEKPDGNSESKSRQSPIFSKEMYCSVQPSPDECEDNQGSLKIHSLNESTLYKVVVEQYEYPSMKQYSTTIKTNSKSQRKPAKPDFECELVITTLNVFQRLKIRWYPCGRERFCDNEESGTHFGVKIKELYSTRKASEAGKEEFRRDFIYILPLAGRVYEIVVYSVNGEHKTYSDSREIFFNPISTPVQHVRIISLPDLSVLISLEPPKHCMEELAPKKYWISCFENFNESHSNENYNIFFLEDISIYEYEAWVDIQKVIPVTQFRVFSRSLEVNNLCMIIPAGSQGLGFEYWMKHKIQVYDHDLPIAKPDFNFKKKALYSTACSIQFQGLPCGQSYDCKNTKPGSEFSLQIKPSPRSQSLYPDEKNGCFLATFKVDIEYEVTLKSSIKENFSMSATKKFKNCDEI